MICWLLEDTLNTYASGTHSPGGRSALAVYFFFRFFLSPEMSPYLFGILEKMIDEPVNTVPSNAADVDSTYSQ